MALQAYAFIQIYGTKIAKAGVFKNSVYTTSVVLVRATILPFIYGPAGPFLMLVFVRVFLGHYNMIPGSEGDWDNRFEEKERGSLMDNDMRNLWIARHLNTGLMGSTAENAHPVFGPLDQNKSGKLTLDEVEDLLLDLGASGKFKKTFFIDMAASRVLVFILSFRQSGFPDACRNN